MRFGQLVPEKICITFCLHDLKNYVFFLRFLNPSFLLLTLFILLYLSISLLFLLHSFCSQLLFFFSLYCFLFSPSLLLPLQIKYYESLWLQLQQLLLARSLFVVKSQCHMCRVLCHSHNISGQRMRCLSLTYLVRVIKEFQTWTIVINECRAKYAYLEEGWKE